MRKWILSASLLFIAMTSIAIAAPQPENLQKRHVIIVTSELSFINYDGTYYLCDNDTPAEMTELGKNCIEISKSAFDYAMKTTGADVMEVNIDLDKNQPVNNTQSGAVASQMGNKKMGAPPAGSKASVKVQHTQPKQKGDTGKSTD